MAGVGGYQGPANPASVSGPGAMSARTDGGPTNPTAQLTQPAPHISGLPYGENGPANAFVQSAPLSREAGVPSPPPVVPFNAPTARPEEPVTAGMPFGDGPGSDALGGLTAPPVDEVAKSIRAAYAAYPSPFIRIMLEQLMNQGR